MEKVKLSHQKTSRVISFLEDLARFFSRKPNKMLTHLRFWSSLYISTLGIQIPPVLGMFLGSKYFLTRRLDPWGYPKWVHISHQIQWGLTDVQGIRPSGLRGTYRTYRIPNIPIRKRNNQNQGLPLQISIREGRMWNKGIPLLFSVGNRKTRGKFFES